MSEIKRMRYFRHEFLDAGDFNDEQEYHRKMRYRHNRDFHTWGIGHGLEVSFAEDQESGNETKVTVNPGTAVDGEGKEIVLPVSRTIDFDQPAYQGDSSYYITIKWHEQPGLLRQEDESKRWEEVPGIDLILNPPENPEMDLVLAIVKLKADKTIEFIDHSIRKYATLEIGDGTVTSFKIADGAVTNTKLADNAVTSSKIVDKAVVRSKIGDNSVNEEKLSASVQSKLVTNGDSHDHSGGDGAQIKHSSLNKDDGANPHGTTALQVGALSINGGTVNGNINCQGYELQNSVLKDYSESLVSISSSGASLTLDLNQANVFDVTLTTNCSFIFSNPPQGSGKAGSFTLILRGTSGKTISWPASVQWPEGSEPKIAGITILSFVTVNGGTKWFGFFGGANFSHTL